MGENIITTRIQLRYATYEQWRASHIILLKGEVAIVEFSDYRVLGRMSDSLPENTPPAIGIKVGDGINEFSRLPWIQAISADVYRWAKAPTKPTYSAEEITGLEEYILEHGGGGSGSGSGSSVARQYQIIEGTNEDINKYFLRYKNDDSSTWTIDNLHPIDLTAYAAIRDWIGATNISSTRNLRTYIGTSLILPIIQSLAQSDTAIENQYVTAVSETDGIINVVRKQINFNELTGTISIAQGGTGLTTLPQGEVLLGNGTNAINSIALSTTMADANVLVPSYVIKNYIDNATAGLTGAMHFIGIAASDPTIDGNPHILDYNSFTAGDVILWQQKEYVWANGWHLLGDESSYAIKGSIIDADIDRDANISQSKINGLITDLNSKVDKIVGKQLSTNDYTDADFNKLASIETGAQCNIINGIKIDNTAIIPQDTIVNLNLREIYSNEFEKLSNIEAGANVNSIEIISLNSTPQPIIDKEVNLIIREFSEQQQEHLESIAHGAEVNVITGIKLNNDLLVPHERIVTIDIANTYSNELEKLGTIARGAQVNTIEQILVNGVPVTINTNEKSVNLLLNESTLPITLLKGATITNNLGEVENVAIDENNKLAFQLHKIAKTGNIRDVVQTAETYITIDCGTSDSDTHTSI